MTKRLIITGGSGFVAGALLTKAEHGWEIHALSRGAYQALPTGVHWHEGDFLDASRLRSLFQDLRPRAVIHAAAVADIDYCKAHPNAAHEVNARWTHRIAALCAESDARMIYVSTDNVFDGERGPYREDRAVGPVNDYGRSKVAGEEAVMSTIENAVVARISLVMGVPLLGVGNSFVSRMLNVLKKGERLGVPDNEIRSPIDVVTLAQALFELAGHTYTGTIHLAGNDMLRRDIMMTRIAQALGYGKDRIFVTDPTKIPGRDNRPLDASLCNDRVREVLETPFLGLADGLRLALDRARALGRWE